MKNVKEIVDAENDGRFRFSVFKKSPTQTTIVGVWYDLSMSPGIPSPQYYAATPLTSIRLAASTDGGIYHGQAVSPYTKYLRQTCLWATAVTATAIPMPMMLLDYLMYYPFIDEGTTDEQFLTNSTTVPRYTDGAGVQVMAVSVAARTGGASFYINYTNSSGVSGRISKTVLQNTASPNGEIVTSQVAASGAAGPFIPLQDGDTGVRSIESVTMLSLDVGLFTLVLVKPLASTSIFDIVSLVENDHFLDKKNLPVIKDDAYLNYICLPKGSLSATVIHGYNKFIFN